MKLEQQSTAGIAGILATMEQEPGIVCVRTYAHKPFTYNNYVVQISYSCIIVCISALQNWLERERSCLNLLGLLKVSNLPPLNSFFSPFRAPSFLPLIQQ